MICYPLSTCQTLGHMEGHRICHGSVAARGAQAPCKRRAAHELQSCGACQVEEEADSVPKRWQREHPDEPTRVFSNATLPGLRHSGVPVKPKPKPNSRFLPLQQPNLLHVIGHDTSCF